MYRRSLCCRRLARLASRPFLTENKEKPRTRGEAGASGSLGGTFDGEGSPSSNGLSLHHDSSFAILCFVRLLSHARMFFLREDAVARVLPLSPNCLLGMCRANYGGTVSVGKLGQCRAFFLRRVPARSLPATKTRPWWWWLR